MHSDQVILLRAEGNETTAEGKVHIQFQHLHQHSDILHDVNDNLFLVVVVDAYK